MAVLSRDIPHDLTASADSIAGGVAKYHFVKAAAQYAHDIVRIVVLRHRRLRCDALPNCVVCPFLSHQAREVPDLPSHNIQPGINGR